MQVRLLPGTRQELCLVMRLASQLRCLRSEMDSISIRGATNHGLQSHGDRSGLQNPKRGFDSFAACSFSDHAVTRSGQKLKAEGRGDSSTGERCIRIAGIGVRFPVAPLGERNGIVAQLGERLDGIEEVAGASPAGSTVSNADEDYIRNYNGRKVATIG